jgi:hypothetical protein
MTLDERQQFERLLTDYAIAEAEVVRSVGRRHDALHACIDFINKRTTAEIRQAFKAGTDYGYELPKPPSPPMPRPVSPPTSVPVGTPSAQPVRVKPFLDADIARGSKHYTHDAPVISCGCSTCCEVRALASIGKPAEGLPYATVEAVTTGN